jgi:flagellar hook-associated protein 2
MTTAISSTTSSASTTPTTSPSPTSSLTGALFQAGGIASGLDTNAIVNSLIASESGPLNALKQRQSDYGVQISTLGMLVTQLQALQTVSENLATNGVVAIQPTSTYSDFSVTGSALAEGSYTISVQQVAKEAKMRSKSFTSAQDASVVPHGNLQFSIDGKMSVVIDTSGKALADIAEAINQKVPELNASVISTTTGYYLNVARKSTGYATTADAALSVVSDAGLVLASQQLAKNAKLTIDGLSVERQSNAITDVIRGATLHLAGFSGLDNQVTFAANSVNTATALNTFVSAYNTLSATVRSQLVTDPAVAYGSTLLSHSITTSIQSAMQRMLSQMVVPTGSVRILADLGLELQRDGSLTLNTTIMNNAISNNPGAVNGLFSTTSTGIGDVVKQLVTKQTNVATGALITQQQSLQGNISDMGLQATEMQSNLDMERSRLVAQFTAMEQLIAGFTSAGSYLTQIGNQKSLG